MKRSLVFLLVLTVFSSCSYHRTARSEKLNIIIDKIITNEPNSNYHWGIQVESLGRSKILYEYNSRKLFIPASNQKLLTAASALEFLGADHTIPTKFYYRGDIQDSVLVGDLIVQGYGDPTLSKDFYETPETVMYQWADSLKKYGINTIQGNIIGDDRIFAEEGLGKGWMLEDIKFPFAAENGAFQFNDNSVELMIIPPLREGGKVKIIPDIVYPCFTIINAVTSINDSVTWLEVERPVNENRILLQGNLQPTGSVLYRSVSLTDPTMLFLSVLKASLAKKNIYTSGETINFCNSILQTDSLKTDYLFGSRSIPLSQILTNMLKESSNIQAETILKLLAIDQSKTGSTENGTKVMQEFLSELGIPANTYRFIDASGLSRYNLISPEQISRVLKFMLNSYQSEIWLDCMPVTGNFSERSGMSFGKSQIGNIKAKTGTMSNIRCLSGYLILADDIIVFSFMVNSHLHNTRKIDLQIYSILSYIIEYLY